MSYENGVRERKKTIMELSSYVDGNVVVFRKTTNGAIQVKKNELSKVISDFNYIPHLDSLIDMIQDDIDKQRDKNNASK